MPPQAKQPDYDLTYALPSGGKEECKVCGQRAEVWAVRRGADVAVEPFDRYAESYCLKHQPPAG